MKSFHSYFICIGIYIVVSLLLLHSTSQFQVFAQDTDLPVCNKSLNFFTLNASSSALQNFSSPNYPLDYPLYSTCAWVLVAPLGQLVKLTFTSFSIYAPSNVDSKQCPYAYVKVTEEHRGGSEYVIGRFCGISKPQIIYSTGGQLKVEFKNTFRILAKGFVAKYTAIQPGTACSPTNSLDENSNILLHTSMGHIVSPRSPGSFSNSVDCTWKISLPQKQAINMTFSSFSKIQRAICSDSSLEVYNSRYGHGHGAQLGMFCGAKMPPMIFSSGQHMSLRLKADRPSNALSFAGNFHSVSQVVNGTCDGTSQHNMINIKGTAGSLFTPDYPDNYPSNKQCTWSITVPAGLNVRLTFHSFDLAPRAPCEDYVEVRDGDSLSSPFKGKFCGTRLPPSLLSSGRHMLVRFKSSYDSNQQGFIAMFHATSQKPEIKTTPRILPGVCSALYGTAINDNLQRSGPSGVIMSPNYPSQYPNSMSCTWIISVDESQRVKLSFNDFWIDDQHGCHGDFLEVRDGKKSSGEQLGQRFCGNKEPKELYSTGPHMWVRFVSDDSATGQGFKAQYSAVSKPFNRFIAVGIAIGAIVLVLIAILVYCKIKKKKEKDLDDEDGDYEHDGEHGEHGEHDEHHIELTEFHPINEPPVNPLLGNKTSDNRVPTNGYDVTYAPNGQSGHPVSSSKEDEQLTSTDPPPDEFAWFKPKKRKSKALE